MPITKATVAQAEALWVELRPGWERELDRIHLAMELAATWEQFVGLRARAVVIRANLAVPETLAKELKVAETMQTQREQQERRTPQEITR